MLSQESLGTLLLVDGHSLAFRSFYAFANSREGGLRTSTGLATSICFGFIKALLDAIAAEEPKALAVAFDLRQPTFRHEADASYKEGRPEAPPEFREDIDHLKQLLAALNVTILTQPGFEADDVLGTLAERAAEAGWQVKLLSGDRDLFQLVDDDRAIEVLHLGGRDVRSSRYSRIRAADVVEKWGITPAQVVDFKALCGDASDNIPGVKGIGEKTAAQLLQAWGSLAGIYAAIDANSADIKPAVKAKLVADQEAAYHSQFMAQIVRDVPLELDLEACRLRGFNSEVLIPLLQTLELQQFLNQIDRIQTRFSAGISSNMPRSDHQKVTELSVKLAIEPATELATKSATKIYTPGTIETGDDSFFTAEETDLAQVTGDRLTRGDFPVTIIDQPEQLAALVASLATCRDRQRPTAWDTETTGLDPHTAELVGLGVCWQPIEAAPFPVAASGDCTVYIPVGHKSGQQLPREDVLDALKPILTSDAYPKVLQNAKFDRSIFLAQGIDLASVVFDPMLASYVLNPEKSHNLTDLGLRYLGLAAQSYGDLVAKGLTIADVEIGAVARYCGTDAYSTFHLVQPLSQELAADPELLQVFRAIELPLEPVLATMEAIGIRIDVAYLAEFSKQLAQDLADIEQQAYAAASEQFNLASPKQLSELLFDRLGLDRKKSRKIKTGYSTDAAVLDKLKDDHPVVAAIVEHRTLSKLKSTYVDALPTLVSPKTERIHTDFNQTATATGRLSSSNPNLQNIPIRTAFSRQIRRAFLPREGWLLVAADYSQIELRILAHLSQEPILIEAYQTGQDVHALTARLLFDRQDITPAERRLGKTLNFGVIYGMGAQRFAREFGGSRQEAKMFIDRFNDRYARVFDYLQHIQKEAIALGYVQTMMGRRRYFEFAGSALRQLRGSIPDLIDLNQLKITGQNDAQLLRAAANAPIQGSSADLIKVAMIQLHEVLKKYEAKLLLQVHDELVLEVPQSEWPELQPQLEQVMTSAAQLSVPLSVDVRSGQNWMEAK